MRQGFWACSRGPGSTGKRTAKQKGHCPRATQGCPRWREFASQRGNARRKNANERPRLKDDFAGYCCLFCLFSQLSASGYGERATSLHLSSRPQLSVAAFDQFGQLRPLKIQRRLRSTGRQCSRRISNHSFARMRPNVSAVNVLLHGTENITALKNIWAALLHHVAKSGNGLTAE